MVALAIFGLALFFSLLLLIDTQMVSFHFPLEGATAVLYFYWHRKATHEFQNLLSSHYLCRTLGLMCTARTSAAGAMLTPLVTSQCRRPRLRVINHQNCSLLPYYLLTSSSLRQSRNRFASIMSKNDDIKAFADKDGHFRRQPSKFRDWISRESGAKFPPEKDRYVCGL